MDGITQVNVSLSHVVASPALVVTAAMFTGDIQADDVKLNTLPISELHPAVNRYAYVVNVVNVVNVVVYVVYDG